MSPRRKPSFEPSNKNRLKVTKIEVAVRQLETAIRLWFSDLDMISVCTLAHASHEVIWQLNRDLPSRRESIWDDEVINRNVREEYQEDFKIIFKMDSWFLKHGGKDAAEVHYLAVDALPMVMGDAINMYNGLGFVRRKIFQVMTMWLWFNKPDMFPASIESLGVNKAHIDEAVRKPKNKFFDLCFSEMPVTFADPGSPVLRV